MRALLRGLFLSSLTSLGSSLVYPPQTNADLKGLVNSCLGESPTGDCSLTVNGESLPSIGNWDVSQVTDMESMFASETQFDQDLSNWSVGQVTTMKKMFQDAHVFNNGGSDGIKNWDTSNVVDMNWMFMRAHEFNQPIGAWDVSNVLDMELMFYTNGDGSKFYQNLDRWNVHPNVKLHEFYLRTNTNHPTALGSKPICGDAWLNTNAVKDGVVQHHIDFCDSDDAPSNGCDPGEIYCDPALLEGEGGSCALEAEGCIGGCPPGEYHCGSTCVSSCSECPDFPTNPASGNVCEAPSGRCGMRRDLLAMVKNGEDISGYQCSKYQDFSTHQGFANYRTHQEFKYCSVFETQGQCEDGFLSHTLREGNDYDLFIREKDPRVEDPSASCCEWFADQTPAWEQEGECLRTGCTEAELEDPFILMLGKNFDWDGGCGSQWGLGASKLCLSQSECLDDSPSCLVWDGPGCPSGQWLNNDVCTEHTSLAGCHASRQVAGTATSDAYCSACSGWALTEADECEDHTVCGNQIGGSTRLQGASSTSAGECAECTEGFAVGSESCEPWVECSGNFELQSPSPIRNRVCGLDEEAFSAFDMGTFVGEEKKERLKIAYRLIGKTNAQREKIAKGDFTELNVGEIKSTLKGTSEFTFDLVGGKGYKKPNTETPPTSTEGWELSAGNRQFRTVKSGEKAHVFWEGQWIEHLFSTRRRLTRTSCESTPVECPGDEGEVCEFEENTLSGCTMEGLCPANHYCPVFDEIIACPANHESEQGTTSLEGCTECAGASLPGQGCVDVCVESGTWKCVDGKNVRDCQLLSVQMQINGCCTGECDVNTEGCC